MAQTWPAWPVDGELNSAGFCITCRSHFCPHAMPTLYQPRQRRRTPVRPRVPVLDEALLFAEAATAQQMARFGDAENTLTLSRTQSAGIFRGAVGEWAVARWTGAARAKDRGEAYDLLTADGVRIDVKTTRRGRPLMVPQQHRYKIDAGRVDVLVLAWYDLNDDAVELVGQISPTRFLETCRDDGNFPIPTLYVDAAALAPVAGVQGD